MWNLLWYVEYVLLSVKQNVNNRKCKIYIIFQPCRNVSYNKKVCKKHRRPVIPNHSSNFVWTVLQLGFFNCLVDQ